MPLAPRWGHEHNVKCTTKNHNKDPWLIVDDAKARIRKWDRVCLLVADAKSEVGIVLGKMAGSASKMWGPVDARQWHARSKPTGISVAETAALLDATTAVSAWRKSGGADNGEQLAALSRATVQLQHASAQQDARTAREARETAIELAADALAGGTAAVVAGTGQPLDALLKKDGDVVTMLNACRPHRHGCQIPVLTH